MRRIRDDPCPAARFSRTGDAGASYRELWPAGEHLVGLQAVHDDELLATGCASDEPHGRPGDTQLGGEQPQQRLVGRALDRRGRDARPQHTFDHAVDLICPRPWSQAHRETDLRRGHRSSRSGLGAEPMRLWAGKRLGGSQANVSTGKV
jgi:hypothetical protein